MTRKQKIILAVVAGLVLWLVVGWFLGPALKLVGRDLWVLRGGLWLLGLVAAVGTLWFFLKYQADHGDAPMERTGDEDIDAAIQAAREQLASSQLAGRATLGNLPLVLVMGPEGSAKTTAVIHSGVEPELLAGEVARGDVVVPTRAVNIWYAQNTILLEAGGGLAKDAGRWARLVRHLQPQRLAAVLGGAGQAPRAAVVCYSVEELTKPGASQTVVEAARDLRARLVEVSQALGIRLPVYVLFTKLDRVPHFADYVQNFSREEMQDALGVTLAADEGAAGQYADREARRLGDALQQLFCSLAEKRLQFLPRETAPGPKLSAYEFPREFAKITGLAGQFLVDLCKPSQLQVSPFLRGFYFTGVKAVMVTDVAAPAAAIEPVPAAAGALKATGVFGRRPELATKPAAGAGTPTTRRVPRWVFLDRVFPEVVLRDESALAVTRGGTRVNFLRRALLATAAGLFLFVAAGFTMSYLANRGLAARTRAAIVDVASLPAPGAAELASEDALRKLDTLRARLLELRRYNADRPLRMQWGLYAGEQLYPAAHLGYYAGFEKLLLDGTRRRIADTLRVRPATLGASEYLRRYDQLKVYLVTTSYPDSGAPPFVAGTLSRAWGAAGQPAPAAQALADSQFDFYAKELPGLAGELRTMGRGDRLRQPPYGATAEPAAVDTARRVLLSVAADPAIYRGLIYRTILDSASRRHAAVRFSRPEVSTGYTVPGEFTRPAWRFVMDTALTASHVSVYVAGEKWVLGSESAMAPQSTPQLVDSLRTRYRGEYVQQWRDFLRGARVAEFRDFPDAYNKLDKLRSNGSPLLALLHEAAVNTAVDTTQVGRTFGAVLFLVPPSDTVSAGAGMQPYMQALGGLAEKFSPLAKAPDDPAAVDDALAAAKTDAAGSTASGFPSTADPVVAASLRSLMKAPFDYAFARLDSRKRALARKGEMEAQVGSFRTAMEAVCSGYRDLMAKYPFNPDAPSQPGASAAEIDEFFQPGSGTLWKFRDDARKMSGQGAAEGQKALRSLQPLLTSADEFVRAYYDTSNASLRRLMLRAIPAADVPRMRVIINTTDATFTSRSAAWTRYPWTPSASGAAELRVQLGDEKSPEKKPMDARGRVLAYEGPWALFDLLSSAKWSPSGPDRYTLEWSRAQVPGKKPSDRPDVRTLRVEVEVRSNLLQRGAIKQHFQAATCDAGVLGG